MGKFKTGQIVCTRGIADRLESDRNFSPFVQLSLGKYLSADWGDTCEEDKVTNDEALKNGERILAVYIYPVTGEIIWIITEWDRSVTTILFPSEY